MLAGEPLGPEELPDEAFCPVVESIRLIGSVWKLIAIRYLMEGPKGFNELLRSAKGLHAKTLSRVLKQLEADGLVERRVISTRPFAVKYSLTQKGKALRPVFEELRRWGSSWLIPRPLSAVSSRRARITQNLRA